MPRHCLTTLFPALRNVISYVSGGDLAITSLYVISYVSEGDKSQHKNKKVRDGIIHASLFLSDISTW